MTTRAIRRVVPAVALLLACGGGDLVLPSDGEPATIEVVDGDAQSGRVGVALADPVVGRVTDSQGLPVADARVAFAFTPAGAGTDATVAPDTATTDADGRATFQVVTGSRVGGAGAELRVSTANGQRTLAASLTFTAVSSDANELTLFGGDGQSAPAGALLAAPLVVQVTDAFGNPIAGVPIAWTIDGGGSLSEETTPTGADGLASVERTLGATAGVQHTIATAPGLAGSPVTFTHTAGSGAATVIEFVSGSGQSAVVGTSLPDPLVVRARDGSGNPVPGLAVAWLVGAGGGSVSPATSQTDADGLASTRWTVGPTAGPNSATAVISGVGTVEFTATAVPGTPPALALETEPPPQARHGVVLSTQPTVQLREPDGAARPLAGVPVSVSVVEGGATLAGTLTRTTGGDGRARFDDLALLGPPGTYTLAFAAAGYSGAVSTPIALLRATTTITIRSDTPDPSVAGAPVSVVFQVQSPGAPAGGAPGGNVLVAADDGTSCTATVAVGACSIAPTAVGTGSLTATYAGDAQFEPSTDAEQHRVVAPPPPKLALTTQPAATAVVGQPLGTQPVVQLQDAQGAALTIAGVSVTASVSSGGGTLGGTVTQVTGADGRAAFTDLSIDGAAGRRVLGFSAPGYGSVLSNSIDVQTAPPVGTTTAITADDPDPSAVGQPVNVRFTVTAAGGAPAGTPAGAVTVSAGPSESCTATVADGACTLTLTGPGSRTLTATYAGSSGFAGSAGSAPHTVQTPPALPSATASTVAVSDASIPIGGTSSVVVTVRDAGNAVLSGVTVTLAGTGTGVTIAPASQVSQADGTATFTFSAGAAGASTLTAVAGGVTLAQQPVITTEQAATTTVITSDTPDPSAPGEPIAVAFTVTSGAGTPSGTVTVTSSGGGSCSGTVADGSCSFAPAGAGALTLTATFAAGGNFAGSVDTEAHTVAAPPPSKLALLTQPSAAAFRGVPLSQQPEVQLQTADGGAINQAGVTVTAALASGGGTLAGTTTGSTDANGRVKFTNLAIDGPPGSYTLRFGAVGFTSIVSQAVVVSLAPSTTTIVADTPDPSDVGQAVSVAFQVTSSVGTPTGNVTVSAAAGESCSATVATGNCSITFTTAGNRTLTATYAGDATFAGSTDTEAHLVSPLPDLPPVGLPDAFTGAEDQTPVVAAADGVLANDIDLDGDPITASVVSAPANGQLTLAADGGFTYVPAPDFAGTDAFTYRVSDGTLFSAPVTATITVAPVNDAPSFDGTPDQTAGADAGAVTVPGWVTNISSGPSDEQAQNVTFVVEVVSGAELFAVPPAVAPDGTLSYTPSGTPGTAQVNVTARDDGGTAQGGVDTSGPRSASIALTAPDPG